MRRRTFLTTGVAFGATILGPFGVRHASGATDRIQQLVFDSTASLLNADHRPLTDDSLVAVWAEQTAFNVDEDGDGNAVNYPDSVRIPLVTSDGGIVGFGAPIVQDDTRFARNGNEEFVLNVLDAEIGGGTVLFDEGHGQFYDTGMFEAFIGYAEANGYTIEATTDIAADLDGAQAAIITSPSEAFTNSQLTALGNFVAAGGSLLLFSQSDFGDYDATTNMNAIAAAVDADFRFNDDQVLDTVNNVGPNYIPVTDEFNTTFEYFAERPGLGFEIDPTKTYTVDVIDVTDGDTIDVRFANGTEDTIRMLGIDAPETASRFERVQEWEGIESLDYLQQEGFIAEDYAYERLAGETVEISFDANEPVRDVFGRLLTYVAVDGTLYNRQIIADGHARVYDSGLTRHDEFLATELDARGAGRNVWSVSDPANSETIRNNPVEELFVPLAAAIESTSGDLSGRVPVRAEATASMPNAPLVAVDDDAGIAMVGSPFIDEAYETAEGYPVDTSGYGNYVFLTHLLSRTTAVAGRGPPLYAGPPEHAGPPGTRGRGGSPPHAGPPDNAGPPAHAGPPSRDAPDEYGEAPVLIDGGHGQFAASYALSAEDAAYYLRYLEGVDIAFEGVNQPATGFGAELLDDARTLLITAPAEAYTKAELDAVRAFRDDGGAVVLFGGAVPEAARTNLNAIAAALGSDLRLGGAVTDATNNLNDDPSVLITSNFAERFNLFDVYTAETEYGDQRGGPGRSRGRGPGRHPGRGR